MHERNWVRRKSIELKWASIKTLLVFQLSLTSKNCATYTPLPDKFALQNWETHYKTYCLSYHTDWKDFFFGCTSKIANKMLIFSCGLIAPSKMTDSSLALNLQIWSDVGKYCRCLNGWWAELGQNRLKNKQLSVGLKHTICSLKVSPDQNLIQSFTF